MFQKHIKDRPGQTNICKAYSSKLRMETNK